MSPDAILFFHNTTRSFRSQAAWVPKTHIVNILMFFKQQRFNISVFLHGIVDMLNKQSQSLSPDNR
jgi:hypothetical protein